jgi:hypothetical protein
MPDPATSVETMMTAEVAREVNLSERQVRNLDAELQPTKVGQHGVRVYSRARVDVVAARRAALRSR